MLRVILLLLFTTFAYADDTQELSTPPGFKSFIENIRVMAKEQGVSDQTLNLVLADIAPNKRVIELDRTQAEFSQNFWRYLSLRVSSYRLKKGTKLLQEHQNMLQEIYKEFGVPPHIIVAFWGLESNFGSNTGHLSLVESLATLAFDERRSEFFTSELLSLLKLIDQGKIPPDAHGSWAGAMGGVQFMPSNVANYGVDADNDGKINLWQSTPDIFSSAANFLKALGWERGHRWGREVKIPTQFDYSLASLKIQKTVDEWSVLGVTSADGSPLPKSTIKASIVLPMGHKGPAFFAYHNFHAILKWNRSILYALSVGHLSDRLAGTEKLFTQPIVEPSLSRDDIKFIQNSFNQMGFEAGEADGISGPKTREATRAYQRENGLPIDGYVGYQLLRQLGGVAND